MLECRGCEDISFRYDWDFDDELATSYYPPRISRQSPKWINDLPAELGRLVREVYTALWSDSPRLAAMGARTILDMVMLNKVGDAGDFEKKLEALQDQGVIAPSDREYLKAAVDAGSAAAHRAFAPPQDVLNQIMDIVEHLLQAVYILPQAADQLLQKTPPRPPRLRASGSLFAIKGGKARQNTPNEASES